MLIILLLFSILYCVHPHEGLDNESPFSTSLAVAEMKEILKKSQELGQDIEDTLHEFIEDLKARIHKDSLKLTKAAYGATLGDFEMICKANAALFCNSVDVQPASGPAIREPRTANKIDDINYPSITKESSSNILARPRCLKFPSSNEYLRLMTSSSPAGNRVDLSPRCTKSELWTIEERNGSVVLKGHTGQYLSVSPNGTVDLVNEASESEMWTSVDNGDGSWSLQGANGQFLSSHRVDKIASLMPHNQDRERFVVDVASSEAAVSMANASKVTVLTIPPNNSTAPKRWVLDGIPRCLKWEYAWPENSNKTYMRLWNEYDPHTNKITFSSTCDSKGLWNIEERNGSVVLRGYTSSYVGKGFSSTGLYLKVSSNDAIVWKPADNGDGSWSLQRDDGKYLSVRQYTDELWTAYETKDRARFWLEPSIDVIEESTVTQASTTTEEPGAADQSPSPSSDPTTKSTSTISTTESTTTVTTTTTTAAPQPEMKSCILHAHNGYPTWPYQNFKCPMNHDCSPLGSLADIYHTGCVRE